MTGPGLSAFDRGSADGRLFALYEMIRVLNSRDDPEQLLESMLDMALQVVGAERGLILLFGPGGEASIRLARNLERETVADAERFSRTVVARAGSGSAVLAAHALDDSRLQNLTSVSLHGICSLICVPLRSRGRIVGTVYVDDRRGRSFSERELRFLEAFADHAALALENTRDRVRLENENRGLQAAAEDRARFGNLVGQSAAMRQVFELIERVADSALPVLVTGESGTGKELVARAIHYNGPRRDKAFVSENCAALPDTLLQSELFGHVRGAFTGAERDRAGVFELADGGTLFLDEIGDMSASMQVQLLRALEGGEVRRVGSGRTSRVDVRLIAATHRNLETRVAEGRFREDLLYRLQVLVIALPPLRERRGDVARLTRFFLQRSANQRGRRAPTIDAQALALLERYRWPGNVRQLEHVLQRLELLSGGGPITAALLSEDPALRPLAASALPTAPLSLVRSERDRIREALSAARGNRSRAARLLGISRATIYRKIKEHEL